MSTVPSSGPIQFTDIASAFGDGSTPYHLSQFYAGGSFVPSGTPNIPGSGAISFSEFRGATIPNRVLYHDQRTSGDQPDDGVAVEMDWYNGGFYFDGAAFGNGGTISYGQGAVTTTYISSYDNYGNPYYSTSRNSNYSKLGSAACTVGQWTAVGVNIYNVDVFAVGPTDFTVPSLGTPIDQYNLYFDSSTWWYVYVVSGSSYHSGEAFVIMNPTVHSTIGDTGANYAAGNVRGNWSAWSIQAYLGNDSYGNAQYGGTGVYQMNW